MCGIVGFYQDNAFDQYLLDQMTDSLAHRGPDGRGTKFWPKFGVGLGHRRLAILDLSSAGDQPMTYQDSGVWICLNGEIYNYLEIRRLLESKGYRFKTNTDTEVALVAFLEWDMEAFNRFNGMWAITIFNEKTRRLVACVDRFGVKPFYYRRIGNAIHWASEIKAFLAIHSKFPLRLDKRGILTGIVSAGGLSASGNTWLEEIQDLPGGHFIEITPNQFQLKAWWNTAEHLIAPTGSLETQAETFHELFFDACKLRLRSDVPIGISLSGGLDSSAIAVALNSINRSEDNPLHLFTHEFPGTALDETSYAKEVINALAPNSVWTKVKESDLDLDKLLFSFEAIYPALIDGPWRIYQAQRAAGVKVSIDGHGADELLGGYHSYLFKAMAQSIAHPSILGHQISQYRDQAGDFFSWKSLLFGLGRGLTSFTDTSKALFFTKRLLDPLYNSINARDLSLYAPRKLQIPENFDLVNRALFEDFHLRLLPRILRNFEVLSMAHGVEVRMPFMDYRLVQFCFSLPSGSKLGESYTKLILRKALSKELPPVIRDRKLKIGFNSPLQDWLPTTLRPFVDATLSQSSPLDDVLQQEELRRFYERYILKKRASWEQCTRFWSFISAIRLSQTLKLI